MEKRDLSKPQQRVGVETGFKSLSCLGTHPCERQGKDPLLRYDLPSGSRPQAKGGVSWVPHRHLGEVVSPSHKDYRASLP